MTLQLFALLAGEPNRLVHRKGIIQELWPLLTVY